MPLIITDIQLLTETREAHTHSTNVITPSMYQVSCNRPTLLFFIHVSFPVSTRFGVY